MRRRELLLAGIALGATPIQVRAQAPQRQRVVGMLSPQRRPSDAFIAKSPTTIRMRELGWVLGENYVTESVHADGHEDLLPELAETLVARGVDVIWAAGSEAAVAAARATKTIPIVFWGAPWPIEQGLVDSYARPGRNVTGVAWQTTPEVNAKRLQFLRELAPQALRVASLRPLTAMQTVSGGTVGTEIYGRDIEAAARRFGMDFAWFSVTTAADFDRAFDEMLRWRADALIIAGTPLSVREQGRIVGFARRERLPAVYSLRSFVEAGGLVSYGIDWRPTMARSMDYVDRILRGANPAELPVDLPSRYELAINLKTARELGLNVPQSVLLGADRVIE